ncbi:hypothetical protein D3C78_1421190 [compost metagenome]
MLGLCGGGLVDPLAALLGVHAAAGDEQQPFRPLAALLQPAEGVAQALHISGAIAGLVVLVGGGGEHDIIQFAPWPIRRTTRVGQVAHHRADHRWQRGDVAAQAVDRPAFFGELHAQAAADITAPYDHQASRHIPLPRKTGPSLVACMANSIDQ